MLPYHSPRKLEQGQSLVEVAISMVFFFFFLLGVLDLGRVYFIYVALEDSAGEAANFLALNPNCATVDDCADPNNANWRAQNAVSQDLDWSEATITVDYPTIGTGVGNQVRVRISYPFRLLTPIITDIVGDDTITITGDATQIILAQ